LLRHTYWINPGDAGLATTTTWALSSDIVPVGLAQWPAPGSAQKERFEEMNTQRWLRKIAIATSLVGLAIGFLLLGLLILIPSNQNNEDTPIASGVVGILLGTAFLLLACSYWRHEALKLRRGGVKRFIEQPNVAPPIGSITGPPQRREATIAMPADLDSQLENS
jgi:hypothetical protein